MLDDALSPYNHLIPSHSIPVPLNSRQTGTRSFFIEIILLLVPPPAVWMVNIAHPLV